MFTQPFYVGPVRKIISLRHYKNDDEQLPFGYRIAAIDLCSFRAICYPIGLHWIAKFLFWLHRLSFQFNPTKFEKAWLERERQIRNEQKSTSLGYNFSTVQAIAKTDIKPGMPLYLNKDDSGRLTVQPADPTHEAIGEVNESNEIVLNLSPNAIALADHVDGDGLDFSSVPLPAVHSNQVYRGSHAICSRAATEAEAEDVDAETKCESCGYLLLQCICFDPSRIMSDEEEQI